jgi:hypothetical protein
MIRVAEVSHGPAQPGWITLNLPAELRGGPAHGVYFYRIEATCGAARSVPAFGRYVVTR